MNLHLWALTLRLFLEWTHPNPRHVARLRELSTVAADVGRTDASDDEARQLASIAVHESGVRLSAVGRAGERGPFQVMGPACSFGASEALRRLRAQGLQGYAGCGSSPCPGLTAALMKCADGGC